MVEKKPEKDLHAADHAPTEGTDEAAAPKRPSAIFMLVKAVGVVAVIVIVEVVAASMLMPSAQDTERLARQYVAASAGDAMLTGHESDAHSKQAGRGEEVHEVELGTFNVTHFNPATNTTLSIDFELFGAVLAEHDAEFHKLFEKNKIRVREQVIMTLHGAESKDLSDAGLGLLKRQILEKTNRALGQPLVREVLFSKFNFIER